MKAESKMESGAGDRGKAESKVQGPKYAEKRFEIFVKSKGFLLTAQPKKQRSFTDP
jgi:hypothetical protein